MLINHDTEIDTEIQLSRLSVWGDRALFYLSKIYTGQFKPGDNYNVFKKCVSISILDFVLFKNETEFYSRFHIMEDTRYFLYTDKMEFHVIELPKLPEKLREDSGSLELWAKFINAVEKEEFDMIAEKDPHIKSAYQKLQIIRQDKDKRIEYEAREKAIRDYSQGIFENSLIWPKKMRNNIFWTCKNRRSRNRGRTFFSDNIHGGTAVTYRPLSPQQSWGERGKQ